MSIMGRPKSDNPKNKEFKTRFTQSEYNLIEQGCRLTGLTRVELTRMALKAYLTSLLNSKQ